MSENRKENHQMPRLFELWEEIIRQEDKENEKNGGK